MRIKGAEKKKPPGTATGGFGSFEAVLEPVG
jgi:hypothetical protein